MLYAAKRRAAGEARGTPASALDVRTDARVHDLIAAQVAATPGAAAVESRRSPSLTRSSTRRPMPSRYACAISGWPEARWWFCLQSLAGDGGGRARYSQGRRRCPCLWARGVSINRLDSVVRDSRMRALVTSRALRADFQMVAAHVIKLRACRPAAASARSRRGRHGRRPRLRHLRVGINGMPKGVLVPHRSVVNLLASVRREPGMTASDVVLAVTTLSFDIAVSEIACCRSRSAPRIALASREVASDGQRLLSLMHESKATFLDATPATWRLLLAAGWKGGEGLKAICTGEAMPRDLGHELLRRCASVWNGYGTTETTVWSTFWQARSRWGAFSSANRSPIRISTWSTRGCSESCPSAWWASCSSEAPA